MTEKVTHSISEIRCPACVPLGWYSGRLLMKVYGKIDPQNAEIQIKCFMCKSIIAWRPGTGFLRIAESGRENKKKKP